MPSLSTNEFVKKFDISGQVTYSDDPFCQLAQGTDGQKRFYVSYLTEGVEAGKMRNHISGTQDEARQNRDCHRSGKKLYELREVSQESFECYIDFLERGDEKALRNAERVAR